MVYIQKVMILVVVLILVDEVSWIFCFKSQAFTMAKLISFAKWSY